MGRVELCVSLGEMFAARLDELFVARLPGYEEAEPFEHGPIAELFAVSDERIGIGFGIVQIVLKTLIDVADAAAGRRVREHVDDRAVFVRDGDARLAAPKRLRPKHCVLGDARKREGCTLDRLLFLAERPGGEHEDAAKELLRKIPMFRCGPATDIARRIQRRNQHPRIFEDLLSGERVEWNRGVDTAPNPLEPTLMLPP